MVHGVGVVMSGCFCVCVLFLPGVWSRSAQSGPRSASHLAQVCPIEVGLGSKLSRYAVLDRPRLRRPEAKFGRPPNQCAALPTCVPLSFWKHSSCVTLHAVGLRRYLGASRFARAVRALEIKPPRVWHPVLGDAHAPRRVARSPSPDEHSVHVRRKASASAKSRCLAARRSVRPRVCGLPRPATSASRCVSRPRCLARGSAAYSGWCGLLRITPPQAHYGPGDGQGRPVATVSGCDVWAMSIAEVLLRPGGRRSQSTPVEPRGVCVLLLRAFFFEAPSAVNKKVKKRSAYVGMPGPFAIGVLSSSSRSRWRSRAASVLESLEARGWREETHAGER